MERMDVGEEAVAEVADANNPELMTEEEAEEVEVEAVKVAQQVHQEPVGGLRMLYFCLTMVPVV